MPAYKSFSQTPAATANADSIMKGDWVKKQDIMYEAVVVYDARTWASNFAKQGENKETATFQLRFEKDVDTLETEEEVDEIAAMLVSFDSARVVAMAHALIDAKAAYDAGEADESPFPFVAVLIEDTKAQWVYDQFGQFPIVFADPTPENLTRPEKPKPAPRSATTTPPTRRAPVSQPRTPATRR